MNYDCIVLGAGISGLSAAYYLKKEKPNLNILIIEAKNRVGGRTQTIELKCSTENKLEKWDAGGQWVTDSQIHITQLLKELNLETYRQHDTGTKILETNGHLIKYTTQIPRISIFSLADLQLILTRINSLAKQINTKVPFNKDTNAYLDDMNLKQVAEKYSFTSEAKSILNAAIRTVYGLETNQLNAHFALMYISSGGSIEKLTLSEKDCAQEKKVKGGTQQISELMLEKCNSKILFECPVVEINQEDSLVKVTILNLKTKQFESYFASKIMSSLPVNQYDKILFKPQLPFYKQNIFKSMKPGNYIKFIATYKKAFWKEMGYSGEVVSDGSIIRSKLNKEQVSLGPIAVMYDNTSYSNEPALLGFIGANAAVQWSDLNSDTRKQEIIQSMCDYFNTNDARELLVDYYEKNWNEEIYNGGCPTYNITSNGLMKDYSRALREPFKNVHFCGTESATQWQGYMDGAVESALRVKNEILSFLS